MVHLQSDFLISGVIIPDEKLVKQRNMMLSINPEDFDNPRKYGVNGGVILNDGKTLLWEKQILGWRSGE
jgi:hypothetical protein